MPQQQHEILQHRDFDQHEAGAERAEVHQPREPAARQRLPASGDQQRPDHEQDDERGRDAEQRHQRAQPVAEQHRPAEGDVELVRELGGVKEERAIVRGRADVGAIAGVELLTVRRQDESRVVGGGRAVHINPFGGLGGLTAGVGGAGLTGVLARRVEHVETKPSGDLVQLRNFSRGERRFLQQEGGDLVLADDGQAIGGSPAALRARLLRERHEAQAVRDPAGNRQHAAVGQVIEIIAERINGIERVFGQRVGAGRGSGPGVDQRRLDHVVALRCSPHEAASVVHRDPDARVGVDAAGKLLKPVAHHIVGDDRIDLDAVHARRAEHQRRGEIPPAAGADDQSRKSGRGWGLGTGDWAAEPQAPRPKPLLFF